MKIGNIELPKGAILAPMAGYTEPGFRAVCSYSGAVMTVTEMISAKGLMYNGEKTLELLHVSSLEKLCAVQIFGSDPDIMAEAVKTDYLKKFPIIDINMGCPVHKVVKVNEGSALMNDINLACKIVSSVKLAANDRPVTVKFRLGWDEDNKNFIEFGKRMQDSGADAITLHSRTRMQFYSGNADIRAWKQLKNAVNIPVIASGDIKDKKGFDEACKVVDGVMIGRGALGRPQIFGEILDKDNVLSPMQAVRMHLGELKKCLDDRTVAVNFRKHAGYYIKGINGAREIKVLVNQAQSVDEVLDILSKILD
jgi:tRNA-dihydrouridine synthase B